MGESPWESRPKGREERKEERRELNKQRKRVTLTLSLIVLKPTLKESISPGKKYWAVPTYACTPPRQPIRPWGRQTPSVTPTIGSCLINLD